MPGPNPNYNPKLNAFITVLREHSLASAAELGVEQRAGKLRGPLRGIPIALKDNIDTAGIRTTAASAAFDDRVPTEDAEVMRRLKIAGATDWHNPQGSAKAGYARSGAESHRRNAVTL